MKAKRALYLCLQPMEQGQASYTHVHEIIRGLEARGWSVTLVGPTVGHRSFVKRLMAIGAANLRVALTPKRPRILYVRAHPLAFPAVLAARVRRVPIVQEVNAPYEDIFLAYPRLAVVRKYVERMARLALTGASAYVVHSTPLERWLRAEVGARTVHVVPNGANVNVFTPTSKRRDGLPERYAVCFGALARWQGIDTILRAMTRPEWPRDMHVVFMGDGPERPKVEAAARSSDKVVYLGVLPYTDVPGVVAGASVGLCVKNYRGPDGIGHSPLKMYETLACGVPVIVTDMRGQSEVVKEHDCGWIVAMDDAGALATSVAAAARDEPVRRRKGAKGRAAVEAAHSWDARAAEVNRVLECLA